MKEIHDTDPTADPARRRERGIEAYARIFDVPGEDAPAVMVGRVGPVFAEEAVMTVLTNYIGYARGSQAMEAVQRVAGSGRSTSAPNS